MSEDERGLRPIVAIVGQPNVGKSTLFNRLVSERMAIVEGAPGVTRDRLYAPANWAGRDFLLVDTGGITDSRDQLHEQVSNQSLLAAGEADVILFVVDARSGILPMDQVIVDRLRRVGRPILLVANKAENQRGPVVDFYRLGLGEAMPISAEHGLGIGDILDQVVALLPPQGAVPAPKGIALAVVGRPNVGKSSLVNALLGVERVIVNDLPGTTRDAVDTPFSVDGQDFTIIDTAGIRRAARIDEAVEYYGVLRAIKAVERCDVVLLMLAADDPGTIQDQRIAGIANQAGKACLLLVNKTDLLPPGDAEREAVSEKVREALSFLDYAPVKFISVREGHGIDTIMAAVAEIAAEHARQVPTSRLNAVLNDAVLMHEPPSYKGRKLRLYYATQVKTKPPVILIHVNDPGLVHFSYERYLLNRFRQAFGFEGTPILLRFKPRGERK